MRITWNNLHYVVISVIILNFIMLYFLKNTSEEVDDLPIVSKENQITTLVTKEKPETKEQSIAEDIGKVFSDSGSPLPLIEISNSKTFLKETNVLEELIVIPPTLEGKELVPPQSKGIALLMLFILISLALCVTYVQIKHMNNRKEAKTYENVNRNIDGNNINNYYILHEE